MTHYRTTVTSSWGQEALFSYMSDFAHSQEWDPGVRRAERASGGAIELGARFHLEVGFLGRRLPLEYVVTAYEPHALVQLTASNGSLLSIDTMTFATRSDGSSLTYDAELRVLGGYRVFSPLLAVGFRRVGERARQGLLRELNR